MAAEPKILLNKNQLAFTIDRLCHELIEVHKNFESTAIIGVQPRGIHFAKRIYDRLLELEPNFKIPFGLLDPTYYRDDFRRTDKPLTGFETKIDFSIENKNVVLIDDVLYTARTIRSALDALLDFGRPNQVQLMCLVERRFSKQLPISADFIGKRVDAIESQKVKVEWKEIHGEDRILILKEENKN